MTLWGFELLRPVWALAIPAVLLLGLLFSRRQAVLGAWDRAVDGPLMAALDRLGKVSRGARQTLWLPPLVAALTALALVGPAKDRFDGTAFRNLDGVVIVMDLSRSMVEGGRFADAVTVARLVADSVGSRQVALVVYGGDAYLASAFTSDAAALGQTIAFLDGETMPDPGSRPERALALARKITIDAEIVLGDIVLITDGDGINAETRAGAARLAEIGAPLSTVYVPSQQGEGRSRAEVDGLAEAGGGARGDLLDPFPVTRALDQGMQRRLEAMDQAAQMRRDYGRWLLILAMVPALLLFRRVA